LFYSGEVPFLNFLCRCKKCKQLCFFENSSFRNVVLSCLEIKKLVVTIALLIAMSRLIERFFSGIRVVSSIILCRLLCVKCRKKSTHSPWISYEILLVFFGRKNNRSLSAQDWIVHSANNIEAFLTFGWLVQGMKCPRGVWTEEKRSGIVESGTLHHGIEPTISSIPIQYFTIEPHLLIL